MVLTKGFPQLHYVIGSKPTPNVPCRARQGLGGPSRRRNSAGRDRTPYRGIAWRNRPHPKDYTPSVAPITRLRPNLTAQVRRHPENCHSTTSYVPILPDCAGAAKTQNDAKNALCCHAWAWVLPPRGPRRNGQGDRNGSRMSLPPRIFLRFPGPWRLPERSLLRPVDLGGLGFLGSDSLLQARLPLVAEFLHAVAGGRLP